MTSHPGERVALVEGTEVVACERCRFTHVVPLPEAAELETFYAERFYQEEKDRYLQEAAEDGEWLRTTFRDRLTRASELAGAGPLRTLDVGCGPGHFLAACQELGWPAVGVEPSPIAAAHARTQLGADVREGVFDTALASALGPFDLVHMSEVLEHVRDPQGILAAVHAALAPGGLFCVSVPNDFNPLQAVVRAELGGRPWWVVPRHHLNYFSFESLEGLLQRCGFEVLHRTTTFPMEVLFLLGQRYVGEPEVGRSAHEMRKRFDQAFQAHGASSTRRRFYDALAAGGLGRLAVIIARRASEPGLTA